MSKPAPPGQARPGPSSRASGAVGLAETVAGFPLVHPAITERSGAVDVPQTLSDAGQGAGRPCHSGALPKAQAARSMEAKPVAVRSARLTLFEGGRAVVIERERAWKDWEVCADCRGEHARCEAHQRDAAWLRCPDCTDEVRCPDHALRGQVSGFTWRSRLRLRRKLNRLVLTAVPLFVTCTYPADECPDPVTFGVQVKRYKAAFRRRFGDEAGFVWKVEFTLRGVPHMHLLVFGVGYREFRDWHVLTWVRCIETTHPDAPYVAGRGVELARSGVNVGAYTSKYVWGDKTYQEEGGVEWRGRRWWGVFGSEALPWASAGEHQVFDAVASRLIRYARNRGSIYNRPWQARLGWRRDWWTSKSRRRVPGRAYPSFEYESNPDVWRRLLEVENARYAVEQGWTEAPAADVRSGLRRMAERAGVQG